MITTPVSASTTGNDTTTTPTGLELSAQPIWQERVATTSVIPINETHSIVEFVGNGTMTVPDTGETINMTNNGTAIISPVTGSPDTITAYGRESVFSEDDDDATAITFYEIVQYQPEPFQGQGLVIAVFDRNATGSLAPFNGIMVVGTHEEQPNADRSSTTTITLWEWESGIGNIAGVVPPASSGVMSDLNFSEFDDSSQSEDFTSFSSFFTDVNGTYLNPDIGFQIDLPTGWKGIEINFLINSVLAAPPEINLLELEGQDFPDPATLMTIVGIDEGTFNMIEGFSELPTLEEGAVGEEETSLQRDNPLDTITIPFGDDTLSCTYFQPSFVSINGINAEERMSECIDEGGINPKIKIYTFATQDNSLIVVGFYGNSTNTYDQNLPLFEESVRTINISQPTDIATSEIYNRYKELVESQLSDQADRM